MRADSQNENSKVKICYPRYIGETPPRFVLPEEHWRIDHLVDPISFLEEILDEKVQYWTGWQFTQLGLHALRDMRAEDKLGVDLGRLFVFNPELEYDRCVRTHPGEAPVPKAVAQGG